MNPSRTTRRRCGRKILACFNDVVTCLAAQCEGLAAAWRGLGRGADRGRAVFTVPCPRFLVDLPIDLMVRGEEERAAGTPNQPVSRRAARLEAAASMWERNQFVSAVTASGATLDRVAHVSALRAAARNEGVLRRLEEKWQMCHEVLAALGLLGYVRGPCVIVDRTAGFVGLHAPAALSTTENLSMAVRSARLQVLKILHDGKYTVDGRKFRPKGYNKQTKSRNIVQTGMRNGGNYTGPYTEQVRSSLD